MASISTKPGHLIRRLHQISTQIFARRMKEVGLDLTPVQYAALDALEQSQGVDQARLAEAVAKDRATVGAVIDRLEQKGLLERRVSDRDARARILFLTPEGEALLAQVHPVVNSLQREILGGLSDQEYQAFIELAAKAAEAARAVDGTEL